MKRYIFSLFLTIMGCIMGTSLQSCSDDLDVRAGYNHFNEDGSINIYFSIPEAEHVVITRDEDNDNGDERALDNVAIIVFNSAGTKVLQRTDISSGEMSGYVKTVSGARSFTYKLVLSGEAINESSPVIYAVANSFISSDGDILSEFNTGAEKSISNLSDVTSKSRYYKNHDTTGAFLMSGKLEGNSVTLNRTAAKITLKNYITDEKKFYLIEDDNDYKSAYKIYNTANSCYVIAPLLSTPYTNSTAEGAKTTEPSTMRQDETGGKRYDSYASPTKTHDGDEIWTYVVIHGNYRGTDGYYAIALKDMNGDPLDILPNYWYEMQLKDVSVPGYATEAAALENPFETGIVVDIHDHAPKVLSMVSDGVHELGATYEIILSNTVKSKSLIVKCFSATNPDDFKFNDLKVEVIDGDDWIVIKDGDGEPKQITQEISDAEDEDDPDNFGHQYEYTVTAPNAGKLYANREGEILVSWKGLIRRVKVIYNAEFGAYNVCKATLKIKNYEHNGTIKTNLNIEDYWKFVGEVGKSSAMESTTEEYEDTPKLFGILPSDLPDDRIRNQGFHFPMPYGSEGISSYEYTVDFARLLTEQRKSADAIESVTATVKIEDGNGKAAGTNFFLKYLDGIDSHGIITGEKIEKENKDKTWVVSLKLKNLEEEDYYEYTTAKIEFDIKYNDGTEDFKLPLDLYHTGFFHYADNPNFYDTDEIGYYYYAVPTLTLSDGTKTYWLDRNIGATSSKRYGSRSTKNGGDIGENVAGGKYLTIAKSENFSDPTFLDGICPPGYHIPTSSEWNDIRLSPNFKTQNRNVDGHVYMSTFYDTGVDQIGDVFFQKGRFFQVTDYETDRPKYEKAGSANSGDDFSGYYWTATVAPAMEKEQMGNWLRVLYFNGSSTSYINGNIEEQKYYVRCKSDYPKVTQTDHFLAFNVHNATHVYLFDRTTKTALYSFPGHAIGTTASASQWQYFYATTSIDLNNLLVVFNKVESNGSITTFIRNDDSFVKWDEHFDDSKLNENNSWDVESNLYNYFDFCNGTEGSPNIAEKTQPGTCIGSGYEGGRSETIKDPITRQDEIIFLWPKTINKVNYPRLATWYWDDDYNGEGATRSLTGDDVSWNGTDQGVTEENDMYKYTIRGINENIRYFNAKVCKDEGDWEGVGFKISYNLAESYYFLVHESLSTSGGSITRTPKSDGGYTWTIQLYDYDGIEGNKPFDPNNKVEQIVWEGYQEENYSGLRDLCNGQFDWTQVPENSIFKIYFSRKSSNSAWWNLSLRKDVQDWPTIYEWDKPDSSPVSLLLTKDYLTTIIESNGAMITGGAENSAVIITKITITPPNN